MKESRNNLPFWAMTAAMLFLGLACGSGSNGGKGGAGGGTGGTGGAGGGEENGGDPELIGAWTGTEMNAADSFVWTFTFEGATVWVTTSGVEAYSGTYTADPLSDPKNITVLIESSPYTAHIGKTENAIYMIEDTTLTFAGNEPGNQAFPTAFEPHGQTRVFVLTKE